MLISNCVARNLRRRPNELALQFEGTRRSWSELHARINRIGNGLIFLGVGPGKAVASILHNSPELVEVQLACLAIGAIYVPIMPGSVEREIAHVLSDVGASIVVCDAQFASRLKELSMTLVTVGCTGSGALSYDDLMAQSAPQDPGVSVRPDAVAMVRYTGGTTGRPKGCIATHDQLGWAAAAYLAQLPFSADERGTISSPLSAGLAIATLHQYVAAGVPTFLLPRYDAGQLLKVIATERITRIYAVETMFNSLVRHPDMPSTDLSSLRLVYGNSPGKEAADGFRQLRQNPTFSGRFYNAYGSTEAGGSVSFNMPDDIDAALAQPELAQRTESIGRVGMFCRIECRSEDGTPVAAGEVGELTINSPSQFSEYHKLPEATAEVLRDGWLYTGDLARMDSDGFIFLAGRKRDMIKSGGLNVYPAEVEGVLAGHPLVEEAAVVGAPDERWGEMVVAFVHVQSPCDEAELAAYCAERLAGYKRPKQYRFVTALPKSETGKILKRELKALL